MPPIYLILCFIRVCYISDISAGRPHESTVVDAVRGEVTAPADFKAASTQFGFHVRIG